MSNKTTAFAKIDTQDVSLTASRMAELETTVREGSRAFMAVGLALAEIRDGKGYKLRGYKTFESYCEKVHGISDRHGRRLIQATETAEAVQQITGAAPASESVARELASVAGDTKKVEKVAAVLGRKGLTVANATAEAVKEAVQKVQAKSAPAANGKQHAPAQAPMIEIVEPLDLALVEKVLKHAEGLARAHAEGDALAADIRRALAQVRGELDRLAGLAQVCKHCEKPGPAGAKICESCGGLL